MESGPRADDAEELLILNRKVMWGETGIECQVDPKHARVLIEEWLEGARAVKTLGVTEVAGDGDGRPVRRVTCRRASARTGGPRRGDPMAG